MPLPRLTRGGCAAHDISVPEQHTMTRRSSSIRIGISGFLLSAAIIAIPSRGAAAEPSGAAAQLQAGIAKVEITDRAARPVNDPCFAKALVLKKAGTTVVLITVDAVA